jgi:hypothetical protein
MSRSWRRGFSSSGRRFDHASRVDLHDFSLRDKIGNISSKLWARMFRVLLLIAMIFQVLGCPYACTATFASQDGSRAVGCRCCQAKRLAAQSEAERHLPADSEQEESHTTCFCKSAVKTVDSLQADQELVSSPIWTIVEDQPLLLAEDVTTISSELRPPKYASGMGLRLAVQSLLL